MGLWRGVTIRNGAAIVCWWRESRLRSNWSQVGGVSVAAIASLALGFRMGNVCVRV